MTAGLLIAALAAASADWIAVARAHKRAEYLFKPLTIVLLMALATSLSDEAPLDRWRWIMLALGFSLAGDVFLMLPRDLFVNGLAAFLVAHVFYVVAFQPGPDVTPWLLVVLVAVVLVGIVMFGLVARGLIARGARMLVLPVAAYVGAISVMLISAVGMLAREDVPARAGWAAAMGGLLFYVSDGLIGTHRFVRPLGWAPVAIMVTYHLGQTGLVLSLLG